VIVRDAAVPEHVAPAVQETSVPSTFIVGYAEVNPSPESATVRDTVLEVIGTPVAPDAGVREET
jgi:hypothetical protein